ncbi:MAG: tyrosine-type recombinase/integrase [Myxococcota bacterium]
MASWGPSPEEHVVKGIDPSNWRRREWRRITQRTDIVARIKDLRDTFGSWLLSNGIPIKYVSKQLGHSSIATTEKHYAKWCHGDDYQDPIRLSLSELPADLLGYRNDPRLTPIQETGDRVDRRSPTIPRG